MEPPETPLALNFWATLLPFRKIFKLYYSFLVLRLFPCVYGCSVCAQRPEVDAGHPTLLFDSILSWNLERAVGWVARDCPLPHLCSPVVGLQAHATMPNFHMGTEHPNWGCHVRAACTLPTKPSPQPLSLLLASAIQSSPHINNQAHIAVH